MSIFKAYDIRGIYPDQLSEEMARKIGNCFAQIVTGERIVTSRDMRGSSKPLQDALIGGMVEAGKEVTNIGLASTPMMNFAVGKFDFDAGVQVTASHNPRQYNGFKTVGRGTVPIGFETGLAIVEEKVRRDELHIAGCAGSVTEEDMLSAYVAYVLSFRGALLPYRVVIDASNGMAGYTLPEILKGLPGTYERLFFELDGDFPNHESNPLEPENLDALRKEVLKKEADIGVIFDGDADRSVYVDERGAIVRPDLVTGIIAGELLQGKREETILIDVRTSWAVRERIEELGCIPQYVRVGHAYARRKLREVDAILGGELAGHYYFRDNYYGDSGVLALLYVLRTLSRTGKKLSELVRPLQKYPGTGELNFRTERKDEIIEWMRQEYDDGKQMVLDGLTVEYEDWWFNLRKSNTEPYLRLNIEARNDRTFEKKRDEVLGKIERML